MSSRRLWKGCRKGRPVLCSRQEGPSRGCASLGMVLHGFGWQSIPSRSIRGMAGASPRTPWKGQSGGQAHSPASTSRSRAASVACHLRPQRTAFPRPAASDPLAPVRMRSAVRPRLCLTYRWASIRPASRLALSPSTRCIASMDHGIQRRLASSPSGRRCGSRAFNDPSDRA